MPTIGAMARFPAFAHCAGNADRPRDGKKDLYLQELKYKKAGQAGLLVRIQT
jgi:hypothetical protein